MKKVLVSLLLVCLTFCLFVGCNSDSVETLFKEKIEPIDESLYTMKKGTEWFSTLKSGSEVTSKEQITEIYFVKDYTPTTTGTDLTEKETGKVKGYVEKLTDTPTYKIYIVGDYIFGNEDCESMFDLFEELTILDFGSFDTSNVTSMKRMFEDCSELTTLDLSNFNTTNVTDMSSMFNMCQGLTSITFGDNFDTSDVTDMNSMFDNCKKLTSLNLSNFNTTNVTDMSSMFNMCQGLTSLNLSNFNTSSVTKMSSMFSDCEKLTSLNISSFDTSKVTDKDGMFTNCGKTGTTIKINPTYKSFFDDSSLLGDTTIWTYDNTNTYTHNN